MVGVVADWFPIDSPTGNAQKDAYMYSSTASAWAHWLPDDAIRTLSAHGYYAARAAPGLRVVSLNSETLIPDSPYSQDQAEGTWPDPNAQMAWLNDTLGQAESRNETVILLCHHPGAHSSPQLANSVRPWLQWTTGLGLYRMRLAMWCGRTELVWSD